MTVRAYPYIIGNAWGKPPGTEGPEHYWQYGTGDERETWRSICGMTSVYRMDEFGGVPSITLTFENNPIKAERCELCEAQYLETPYGKKYGVREPYTDARKGN